MKKAGWKERFSYWFDNKMSGGSLSLIKLLAVVSLAIVVVIAVLVSLFGQSEDGFLSALWNSLATVINAWMPFSEDGGPGYLIFMAIASIVGLLVTSILIGIIAAAIEEKVNDLKRGTSRVLEEGHTVVLGFYPGEYTLLRQLVLAAGDEPCCIVVAGSGEREEMEQYIRDNVETPKNVRILYRTADIFDPTALERCAVADCRSVIVSPTDDYTTVKALLAVSALADRADRGDIRVNAVVSRAEYVFPPSIAQRHNVVTVQTDRTIAKLIAHSCTQPGLADTFREMFHFEGAELYDGIVAGAAGQRFCDLVLRMDGGVPVGLLRGGESLLSPAAETVVEEGDKVLFFAEDADSVRLTEGAAQPAPQTVAEGGEENARSGAIAIIGGSEELPTILRELPENISKVILAGRASEYKDEAMRIADERGDFAVSFFDEDVLHGDGLETLAGRAAHIVLLSDREKDDDAADMESIFLLLNLRDIRARRGLRYNITAEMRREANHDLLITDDDTDFVVASDMSSLILAQIAEDPDLFVVFEELLSNEGSELYLKKAGPLSCAGRHTTAELRQLALARGYILLGWRGAGGPSVYDPPLGETIELKEDDSLIVIGQE